MQQSILAVDDEIHMLRLLQRIISEKTPYAITTTSSSVDVPSILEEHTFDLVIADLKMPVLDGLDLLRWLKEHQREEELIILTAFGSIESAVEALSLGVFDYITKPFKKEQILFTVERAMRWQRVRREADEWRQILETEPFEEALSGFRSAYVRRLVQLVSGNLPEASRRSGLPLETIEHLTHPTSGNEVTP